MDAHDGFAGNLLYILSVSSFTSWGNENILVSSHLLSSCIKVSRVVNNMCLITATGVYLLCAGYSPEY